jgi:hypothetical protein
MQTSLGSSSFLSAWSMLVLLCCDALSEASALADEIAANSWTYAFNQYLVAVGYIVLSVNYRGGTGYGLDCREAGNFGPGGGRAPQMHSRPVSIMRAYITGRRFFDRHLDKRRAPAP